ncbi:hypothetical protein SpCBS45565_g02096 [Spizellomyces sp. 'palustris']|nr:hypothetical protein SpCBS45565_g02096 [Spizellomyces sp. 'palustris']
MNITASDAPAKLSRKARRALQKSPASPESSTTTARNSEINLLATTEDEADGTSSEAKSPYVEVVNKKLRALKKKLTKVEKYEQLEKKDLNQDQIQALERKPEVVSAVKELEDVVKQIAVTEAEESKVQQQKQQALEQTAQLRVERAVQEVKAASSRTTREILQLFYVLNITLPSIVTSNLPITDEQYNALAYFRAVITGVGLEQADSTEDFLQSAESHLHKYLERQDEPFVHGVTYGQLAAVVDTILNPPAPPKFGTENFEEAILEEPTAEDTGLPEEERDHVTGHSIASNLGTISFFNPSEVLGITTETTEISTEENGIKTDIIVETITVVTPEAQKPTASEMAEPAASGEVQGDEVGAEIAQGEQEEGEGTAVPSQGGQHQGRQNRGRGRGGFRGRGRGRGGQGGYQGRGGFRGRGRGGPREHQSGPQPQ